MKSRGEKILDRVYEMSLPTERSACSHRKLSIVNTSRRGVSLRLAVLFLGVLTFAGMACSGKKEGVKPETTKAVKPETAAAVDPNAVKVLIRKHETGVLAFDGQLFGLHLVGAVENPEVKESVNINSGQHIKVEEEDLFEIRGPIDNVQRKKVGLPLLAEPKPAAWSKDPKAFEFVLNWTLDWKEHPKSYDGEELRVTVKETLKAEKVLDPKVAKTWTYTYVLSGGKEFLPSSFSSEGKTNSALEQTKNVIVPARGPVLKEALAFINANRTSQK